MSAFRKSARTPVNIARILPHALCKGYLLWITSRTNGTGCAKLN
jgi:hypothetical protein